MKVKKHNLLLIASIVWLIAGFNILKLELKHMLIYKVIKFLSLNHCFYYFLVCYILQIN